MYSMSPFSSMDFNPRSPQGGATFANWCSRKSGAKFQSTLPARGSDGLQALVLAIIIDISIHAPRKGERLYHGTCKYTIFFLFQSTLPARGSDHYLAGVREVAVISIHAPRKGERQRKSAFVCSISANLLNIIHCGTVTRTVSRRRIALFRLFSVRRSGVFMYAYASH